jgi:hypothetical protein
MTQGLNVDPLDKLIQSICYMQNTSRKQDISIKCIYIPMEKIKLCLCDLFQQNWNGDLQTCSKAINIRIFKYTFGFEDYFNILDENDFWYFANFEQLTMDYQLSVADVKI